MNKIVPLLLFLSCLLSSCWQDVYVDWDGTPVQLSLTTRQLCADSAIQIDIQPASRDAYRVHGDSLRYYLQVELWVNGAEQGKMYIEKSADSLSYLPYATTYYTSTYIPKAGDRIGIRATCEGFEPLTAETVIPSVVPIEKLGYTYEFDTIDYQLHMAFQLTFRDNPSTADYYAYSYMLLTKDSLGRFVYTPYSFGYGYGFVGVAEVVLQFGVGLGKGVFGRQDVLGHLVKVFIKAGAHKGFRRVGRAKTVVNALHKAGHNVGQGFGYIVLIGRVRHS